MTALHEFEYDLPTTAIAQSPVEPRDSARLLVALDQTIEHRIVRDLPELIRPGDVVVVNETRVLPARLRLQKSTGGSVEVLLLEQRSDESWEALVKPSRRVAVGSVFRAGPALGADQSEGEGLDVEVGEHLDCGQRLVWLRPDGGDVLAALARFGVPPLPPYITAPLDDAERYQTVFARLPGSVAAPTAGLHLTTAILDRIVALGASVHRVELRIGLDTFRPVTVERVEDHRMHSERYEVPEATLAACLHARAAGHRVVAVGTTTLRALESAVASGELTGRTNLFIHGNYKFGVVDVLLTNFHLPRSTLLILLEAFVGPRWRDLYRLAASERYRFLSFGDAMLVTRQGRSG